MNETIRTTILYVISVIVGWHIKGISDRRWARARASTATPAKSPEPEPHRQTIDITGIATGDSGFSVYGYEPKGKDEFRSVAIENDLNITIEGKAALGHEVCGWIDNPGPKWVEFVLGWEPDRILSAKFFTPGPSEILNDNDWRDWQSSGTPCG